MLESARLMIPAIITAVSDTTPDEKRDRERRIPEAPSPRMITTSRDIMTADSTDYPPSRYEDLKREQVTSVTAFVQPREVPLPGQNQGLPNISNPVGGGQGVGGMPVQAQLFPPMKADADVPRSASIKQRPDFKQKKSVFDSSKAPAGSITVGKLAISDPVLAEGGSNPLDKVATIDLATAAQIDKERREQMRLLNDSQPGPRIADMAKTQDMAYSPRDAPGSEASRPESATLGVGTASGWQLSPSGKDELRRRSPRRMASNASEKSSTTQTTISTLQSESSFMSSQVPSLPEKSPARFLPRQQPLSAGGVNPIIRPSRQLAPTPEPVIEPQETPVQKMTKAGLPLNPRSRSVRKKEEEAGLSRQETVMFVNNIVYDDPDYVERVMTGVKPQPPKTAPLPSTSAPSSVDTSSIPTTPGTATSIVHRPRPIPRKPADSDQTFYPPVNQGHRKSRSAGSVLRSTPGSPTQLPPLPPPPMMKPSAYRRQPNDTKSMTFDEKVKYLFPSSQENERPVARRRSSNPELPASFMSDSPTLTDGETQSGYTVRDSKRTQSSVRTRSIFDEQDRGNSIQREMSIGTYQGLIGNGEELLDENALGEGRLMSRNTGGKRASSPILPLMGDFKSPMSGRYDDETGTNLDSGIYSPLPIQQIGMTAMPMQARAVEVSRPSENILTVPQPAANREVPTTTTGGETMTFMLDSAVARDVQQGSGKSGAANSPMRDVDQRSIVDNRKLSTSSAGPIQTHHIGDETPSFSTLSEKRGSRRGPPPTPLVLSERPTSAKQAALAKAAELSPLPSPGEALMMIQAQLKKYEEPNRSGNVESPGRLALLNDLEKEMGMQETRWLGMQNAFSRDSLSTIDVSPTSRHASVAEGVLFNSSENSLSGNSSVRSNLTELENSRRSRLGSVSSILSTRLSNGEPGTRATLWQKRLEEAQLEYMENANELIRKRSVNFLTAPKSGGMTPTPPDSQESDAEIETRKNFANFLEEKARSERAASLSNGLWVPPSAPENRDGLMWVRPERPYHVFVVEPPLPGLSVRPAQRRESSTLLIASTQLWQKPAAKPANISGLWKSTAQLKELNKAKAASTSRPSFYNPGIQRSRSNPSPAPPRPLTQRPPRRIKRITALPDILEDPQPLPNKRDTLGIFQFPWGEKSDLPTVPQPASRQFTAMPGTMSTYGSSVKAELDARSHQLEAAEYSSSFFDDYEDDASDKSSDMGSPDDEGFDETTLFEIASLLKSTNVPSTQSFFGPSSSRDVTSDFLADYVDDEDRYEEARRDARRDDRQTILVGIEEEFEALQEMKSAWETSPLWKISEDKDKSGTESKGLPQPENWEDQYDQVMETARAKPRLSVQPPTISSDNLWSGTTPKTQSDKSPLWTPLGSQNRRSSADETSSTVTRSPSVEEQSSSGLSTPEEMTPTASGLPLWTLTEQKAAGDHGVGLPHPADWESYDTVKSTVRAKPRQSVPAVIESVNMWSPSSSSSNEEVPLPSPPKKSKPVTISTGSSRSSLWEMPEKRVQGDHGVGLPHPMNWASYDNVKDTARAKPRQASEPAIIESVSLWRVAVPEVPDASALMWAPKTKVEIAVLTPSTSFVREVAPVATDPKKTQTSKLLWAVTPPTEGKTETTLFDLNAGRTEFRSTDQPPAALDMDRRRRSPELKSLDSLSSYSLWAVEPVTSRERNWIMSQSFPVSQGKTEKVLWSAPQTFGEASDDGLFDPTAQRTDFKTTLKAPAALEASRKPRKVENKGLEPLNSTNLWTAASQGQTEERNWISSSPVDNAKVKTSHKIPLASERDWEAALQEAVNASYPSRPRAERKTPIVTPEQWKKALDQAVTASYPRAARKAPIAATAADWAAALADAVKKSTTPNPNRSSFDAARRHPVFADALSLTSKASITHPAATGYIHDVSRIHPVFAASSLTSKAEVTHPAAMGYTHDVATVHPVFFGSGAGEQVHPAMPSSSEPDASDAWLLAAKVEVAARDSQLSSMQRSVSKRGQGSRISKMLSRFQQDDAPAVVSLSRSPSRGRAGGSELSRSRSIIRDQAAEMNRRVRSTSRGAPSELERGRKMRQKEVPSVPAVEPVAVAAPAPAPAPAPVEVAPVEKVEPVVEPTVEPVAEKIVESVVEQIIEPVIEPTVEQVNHEAKPVVEAEPVAAMPEFFLPASTYQPTPVYQPEPAFQPEPTYQDPTIMAQIEALEQERLFAQQWALGAHVEPAHVADETIFLPSTPPAHEEEDQRNTVILPANASFFNFGTTSPTATRPNGRLLSIITSEPLFEALPSPSTHSAVSRNNADAGFKTPVESNDKTR